jgi:hypothetical protein
MKVLQAWASDRRIRHFHMKHSILLLKKLSGLILLNDHLNGLYAGPQLMLTTLQLWYWTAGGWDLVRQFVRKCGTSRHQHVTPASHPTPTVNTAQHIQHTAVKYAKIFALKATLVGSRKCAYVRGSICVLTSHSSPLTACRGSINKGTHRSLATVLRPT